MTSDFYVYNNKILDRNRRVVGVFSSHWAAVAALLRLYDPNFRSFGGDREDDLAVEAKIRA